MIRDNELRPFRFWCQKVLPLVYDDSLSYYEVLCKVVKYINNLIEQDKVFDTDITQLQTSMENVQRWIDDFDEEYAEQFARQIITETIATMIFVGLSESGYIVYYIPEEWSDIVFNTTGLDITVPETDEFGRLVLSY